MRLRTLFIAFRKYPRKHNWVSLDQIISEKEHDEIIAKSKKIDNEKTK